MGIFTNTAKEEEKAQKLAKRATQIAKLSNLELIMLFMCQMEDGCRNDQQIVNEMLERLPAIDPHPDYE